MPEALLEAKEIVKSFGRVRALRGASFSVYPGARERLLSGRRGVAAAHTHRSGPRASRVRRTTPPVKIRSTDLAQR
jgi:hypothetical protein